MFDEIKEIVLQAQFGKIKKIKGFLLTNLYWLIDSRYSKSMYVSKFLEDQLDVDMMLIRQQAAKLRDEKDPDKTVINIQRWIIKNFKYRSDIGEQWFTAAATFNKKYGDCDDLNGLLYVMCRIAGIPSHNIYVGLVDTNLDEDELIDHYTIFYWSTKTDSIYNVDTTFNINTDYIISRKKFNIGDGINKIYYLFNENNCWRVK